MLETQGHKRHEGDLSTNEGYVNIVDKLKSIIETSSIFYEKNIVKNMF